jgi:hypothetical protein
MFDKRACLQLFVGTTPTSVLCTKRSRVNYALCEIKQRCSLVVWIRSVDLRLPLYAASRSSLGANDSHSCMFIFYISLLTVHNTM